MSTNGDTCPTLLNVHWFQGGNMAEALYDVAVVGAGLAGKVAALRAAQLGSRVILFEAGRDANYPANSRYTGGVFHVAFKDIRTKPRELRKAIEEATGGFADDGLAMSLADTAARAIDWLGENGAIFGVGGELGFMRNMLYPYSLQEPGFPNHWPDKGADRLLNELEKRFLNLGGVFRLGTRGRQLTMSEGRCIGLEVETSDGRSESILATAVVLADGGFQGNPEMVKQHISPRPDALCARGAGTGVGDGIRMAAAVKGQLSEMHRFYGHVQCAEAVHNNELWPYPILDIIASASIVVDAEGKRFTDEGLGGVSIANAIAAMEDPLSSFAILDEHIWDVVGKEFLLPPNPTIEDRGAKIIRASSIEQLAADTGLPVGPLTATLRSYNAAVSSASVHDLDVPRTATSSTLSRAPSLISERELVAIRLSAGITYTMGGIMVDPDGRVMGLDGGAIDGLYAAGSTTAGLEGGPASGYVGGLAKTLVLGLRAGEHAARKTHSPAL
ncbi:FAD-dependent oxidoreductase [Pseudarthrobacter sulfonivorans]|uniref:FAD-dependent oxidoreductase n=1 Tax=Pseudarthrobacter sulfonivorans TaxID=121292 RepID=UPI00277FB5B2|nr:FAD-dependent oxidoreductase [Pseudarthrobacter sulfonivorans]MDP9998417.1 fumarate reductase flavoprotein subunit [Pseudarthrobacter sulfonivorans]